MTIRKVLNAPVIIPPSIKQKKRPIPRRDIISLCLDPDFFGPWFHDMNTWGPWFTFLRTVFGLGMRTDERKFYRSCTKREKIPTDQFDEVWLTIGRRGGKSRVLALIAVFLACFHDWRPFLSPGERGTIVCVATDRKQARIIFRYIDAFLTNIPMLNSMVTRRLAEAFELNNQVTIEVHTASFRGVRGYTIIAALLDEIAFFRSENSFNPDHEIIEALRPGMATIPGAMLLCASSPYARRGELYNMYKKYFGVDDASILVWKAPTRVMNPSVPQSLIDRAYERDPASANAEYGAEFRTDVEAFVTEEAIDSCVSPGVFELKPVNDIFYVGFTDPSGGSKDSFTLAIAHDDKGKGVLDCVREVIPPFSPEDAVIEFCAVLKSYGINTVVGDRYGGEWPRERFETHGVFYDVADRTKNEIYRDFLPIVNSRNADLLEHKKLRTQLLNLERRTARGGRDSIDHPPGGHDDVANSVAGALVNAVNAGGVEIW